MKPLATLALAAACALALHGTAHSQAPAPSSPFSAPAATVAKAGSPLDQLKALRAENEKLIEKQKALLQQLDELDKAAQQLKMFARKG